MSSSLTSRYCYFPALIRSSLNFRFRERGENCFVDDKYSPNAKIAAPWARSPNMTPKRNGKVTIAKIDGFIS